MTEYPWAVIPARGGSRGVPRKNLRLLLGEPLISYTIKVALAATLPERVVVITDDDEIEEVAVYFGANVIRESADADGSATLDQLMLRHVPDLMALGAAEDDVLLTLQPTCPLITADRVVDAMREFAEGAGSVITVKDDRHLTWGLDPQGQPKPLYEARVNRQQLPAQFRESGAIIGARISSLLAQGTRIVEPVKLIELPEAESLDIDTFADLAVAEHWLTRLSVVIRADAGPLLGMGHVYRALALAQELARHRVLLVTSAHQPLGGKFFENFPFEHIAVSDDYDFLNLIRERQADLVVLDVLDTSAQYVLDVRAAAPAGSIVSFEDLGPGAELVDLLVSDIYENPRVPRTKQLVGVQQAILAPSFESLPRRAVLHDEVNEILVLFGGTDPAGLAEKSLQALANIKFDGHITLVRGLGAQPAEFGGFDLDITLKNNVSNMASLMAGADLALSSAGRTLTELATLGVPTLCMAQNPKELTHTHATIEHGVEMLGLGTSVPLTLLENSLTSLIQNQPLRARLAANALASTAGRSNSGVVAELLSRLNLTRGRNSRI